MARQQARHRARGWWTPGRTALAAVCAVALSGATAGALVTKPWDRDGTTAAGPSAEGAGGAASGSAGTSGSAGASGSPTTDTWATVWTGTGSDPMVPRIASSLARTSDIALSSANSADNADVVLTTSATTSSATVATTPVVLAMPAQMAQALGTPDVATMQKWLIGSQPLRLGPVPPGHGRSQHQRGRCGRLQLDVDHRQRS